MDGKGKWRAKPNPREAFTDICLQEVKSCIIERLGNFSCSEGNTLEFAPRVASDDVAAHDMKLIRINGVFVRGGDNAHAAACSNLDARIKCVR